MSRSGKPLIDTAKALPRDDTVEVFVIEGGYVLDGESEGEKRCRFLTILVNLDGEPKQRVYARELQGAIRNVSERCEVFSLQGIDTAVGDLLSTYPASELNIVIQLPELVDLSLDTADEAISHFCSLTKHRLGVIVAVAQHPADWERLTHVSHFVVARASRIGWDAMSLVKSLATLMAPLVLGEADAEDFKVALGTARAPSALAHAVWLTEESRLQFVSEQDRKLVAAADIFCLTPFWVDAGLKEAKQLFQQWFEVRHADALVLANTTSGFFETSRSWPSDWSPIVALCRHDST